MLRILYIADPNMIHDLKWISFFSAQVSDYEVFMLVRRSHAEQLGAQNFGKIESQYGLKILGIIDDFSVVRFWKTWAQARQIRAFVKSQNIDILHIMYAEPNALWANISLPKNVRRILTTRGTDVLKTIPAFFEQGGLLAGIVSRLYRRAFGRFEHITCTSTRQMQSVARLAPIAQSRLRLVRTGIDTAALDAQGEAPKLASEKPFILFPRNMRPLYNHELALSAAALLPAELRERYQLVFVHRNSPDVAYVAKIEQILSTQTMDYTFLEHLAPSALFALYRKAAAVVMTPTSDGTPVSALEAMAVGAPLILGALEYDPDLFPSDAVVILPDWEPQSLADALSRMLAGALPDLKKAAQLARTAADRTIEMQKLAQLYASHATRQ